MSDSDEANQKKSDFKVWIASPTSWLAMTKEVPVVARSDSDEANQKESDFKVWIASPTSWLAMTKQKSVKN